MIRKSCQDHLTSSLIADCFDEPRESQNDIEGEYGEAVKDASVLLLWDVKVIEDSHDTEHRSAK